MMLFGPPARQDHLRLAVPFMELFPSRLSDTPGGLAAALRTSFEVVGHLEHAVVFIDEVEEIASRRGGIPPSPTQGVTNELLKLVADFRTLQAAADLRHQLRPRARPRLSCATGGSTMSSQSGCRTPRPGRRSGGLAGVVPSIDLGVLVAAGGGFTPADIEYAARKACGRLSPGLSDGRQALPGRS